MPFLLGLQDRLRLFWFQVFAVLVFSVTGGGRTSHVPRDNPTVV